MLPDRHRDLQPKCRDAVVGVRLVWLIWREGIRWAGLTGKGAILAGLAEMRSEFGTRWLRLQRSGGKAFAREGRELGPVTDEGAGQVAALGFSDPGQAPVMCRMVSAKDNRNR